MQHPIAGRNWKDLKPGKQRSIRRGSSMEMHTGQFKCRQGLGPVLNHWGDRWNDLQLLYDKIISLSDRGNRRLASSSAYNLHSSLTPPSTLVD